MQSPTLAKDANAVGLGPQQRVQGRVFLRGHTSPPRAAKGGHSRLQTQLLHFLKKGQILGIGGVRPAPFDVIDPQRVEPPRNQ